MLSAKGIPEGLSAYIKLSGNTVDIVTTVNGRELLLFMKLRLIVPVSMHSMHRPTDTYNKNLHLLLNISAEYAMKNGLCTALNKLHD